MFCEPGEINEKFPADRVCSNPDDLTDAAIERLDYIDNTTHNYICDLVTGVHKKELLDECNEVAWNMEHIGEINAMAIRYLKEKGFHVWHPHASDKELAEKE